MKPVRIQLSRAKGWRMPPNTIKVDRTSKWGNPIKVGGCARIEVEIPSSRSETSMYDAEITQAVAVEFFREYIAGALLNHPDLLDPLRGKNLGCWCSLDQACHADVLLDLSNK